MGVSAVIIAEAAIDHVDVPPGLPCVEVPDPLSALSRLAHVFFGECGGLLLSKRRCERWSWSVGRGGTVLGGRRVHGHAGLAL